MRTFLVVSNTCTGIIMAVFAMFALFDERLTVQARGGLVLVFSAIAYQGFQSAKHLFED